MSHADLGYWKTIPGWFNFEDVYRLAVVNSRDGDTLVEVGVFLGKSLCMLLEEVDQSGKKLSVMGVDKFEIDEYFGNVKLPWGELAKDWKAREGDDILYVRSLENISRSPHTKHLSDVRRIESNAADACLRGRTCSFVYLDANHTYEYVLADMHAWYPMLRPGGLLAGHDLHSKGYNCGVSQAVTDFVAGHPGMTFEAMGPNSWIIHV